MADIIELEADQSPPEAGDWLLLQEGPDGLFKTASQRIKGHVTHLTSHTDRWPLKQAVEKAQDDAHVNRIPVIYVRRQSLEA